MEKQQLEKVLRDLEEWIRKQPAIKQDGVSTIQPVLAARDLIYDLYSSIK